MLWSQKTRRATGLLLHRIPTPVHSHFYPTSFCSQIPRCPRTSQIPAPGDSRRPAEGGGWGREVAVHFRSCRPPLATPWSVTGMNHPPPAAGVTQWSGQPARPPARGHHRLSQQQGARGGGIGSRRGWRPGKHPSSLNTTSYRQGMMGRSQGCSLPDVSGRGDSPGGDWSFNSPPEPGKARPCGTRARSPLAPTGDAESPEKRAAGE